MEASGDPNLGLTIMAVVAGFPFGETGLASGIVFLIILWAASALMSGSEVAFFSLGSGERNRFESGNEPRARKVLLLLSRPEELLATLQTTILVIDLLFIGVASWLMAIHILPGDSSVGLYFTGALGIVAGYVFLGKLLPGWIIRRYAEGYALASATFILFLHRLLNPVVSIRLAIRTFILTNLKLNKRAIDMKKLSEALQLNGKDLLQEEKILKGIVRFGDIDVSEIMRPRVDMIAVDIQTPFPRIIDIVVESGYSRIPVYLSDLDHIKGILYVKDLLPHFHKPVSFRWQSLVRPPNYVPENKKINDLLAEFQQNKNHLAIVVDEYGGTSGLITLEDILEEIVGEISDESDEEELPYTKISDIAYLFSGKTSLHDVKKVLGLPSDFFDPIQGDSETLAGLVLEIRGELPKTGDRIEYEGYSFTIRSVDDRRIREIQITCPATGFQNN